MGEIKKANLVTKIIFTQKNEARGHIIDEDYTIEYDGSFIDTVDKNIEGLAENHIEGWKKRYFGYTIEKLKFDLTVNHDNSLEMEYIEKELGRNLNNIEQEYLSDRFVKEVINQYENYSINH